MTGPPDEPSDRPTRMTEIGGGPQLLEQEPEVAADGAPQPWYRNRVLLALWALMVALLLTLIIYGIVELSRGGGETSVPPKPTTTTTTTPSSTTSPTPSTTTPETTTEPPPPETTEESTEEVPPPPPPAPNTPAPTSPPKHHHHLHLPHFS